MKRYYTRACNFYYGKESEILVNKNKTSSNSNLNSNVVDEVINKNKDDSSRSVSIEPEKKDNSLDDILKDVNLSNDSTQEPFEFKTDDTTTLHALLLYQSPL